MSYAIMTSSVYDADSVSAISFCPLMIARSLVAMSEKRLDDILHVTSLIVSVILQLMLSFQGDPAVNVKCYV